MMFSVFDQCDTKEAAKSQLRHHRESNVAAWHDAVLLSLSCINGVAAKTSSNESVAAAWREKIAVAKYQQRSGVNILLGWRNSGETKLAKIRRKVKNKAYEKA